MDKKADFVMEVTVFSGLEQLDINHPSELDENQPIAFHCPGCGHAFPSSPNDFGQVVTCPQCKATTLIRLPNA